MNADSWGFLLKAERAVHACEGLYRAGYPDFAVSRAYYVMLYAADALLAARGVRVPDHEGTHAAFAAHFIGDGQLAPAYHQRLVETFSLRLTADYDPHAVIPVEDAARVIADARDFLEQARRYLWQREAESETRT